MHLPIFLFGYTAGFRDIVWPVLSLLLLTIAFPPHALAKGMQRVCPDKTSSVLPVALHAGPTPDGGDPAAVNLAASAEPVVGLPGIPRKLIVIGFMGGSISADDPVHRESQLARHLQQLYPSTVETAVFANRDGPRALATVLRLLGEDGHGCLSLQQKESARVVIYGHSWGASQTVTLARHLNHLGIPVLLTIQVDSVRKLHQEDGHIPPNVREAVNFYQTAGWLRGRTRIRAMDPSRTTIMGNFESSYRNTPVSCTGFPWYARAFMRPHIEIENDPLVWNKIESLIAEKIPEHPAAPLRAADTISSASRSEAP